MEANTAQLVEGVKTVLGEKFAPVETRLKSQDDQIKSQAELIKTQDVRLLDLEQKLAGRSTRNGTETDTGSVANVAKIVASDERIKQFRKGDIRNLKIDIPGGIHMLRKSVLGNLGTTGVSPAAEYPGFPQQMTGVPQSFARRRLVVLEALSTTPVSTEGVNWPRLDSNSDAAAPQTHEGAAKSETVLTFDREQLKMVTVAHYLNATTQVLADNPMLVEFLNSVLIFDAMKKFEDLIVSGNGEIGSDQISGLITQGTVYAATLQHAADMIGQSITNLTSLGYSPDLVILNPATYFEIVSARDANQRYIAGGWAAPRPNNLWGVNVAQSAGIGVGTAIVMDTSRATILDRESASIRMGWTGNQFIENQITILAELRGNLGVYDAKAINVVSVPSNSP
jgi:HK97 family phage major capsid protein